MSRARSDMSPRDDGDSASGAAHRGDGKREKLDLAALRGLALKFSMAETALETRSAMAVLNGKGAEHVICYTRETPPQEVQQLPGPPPPQAAAPRRRGIESSW